MAIKLKSLPLFGGKSKASTREGKQHVGENEGGAQEEVSSKTYKQDAFFNHNFKQEALPVEEYTAEFHCRI